MKSDGHVIVGIDPGITGAAVALNSDGEIIGHIDFDFYQHKLEKFFEDLTYTFRKIWAVAIERVSCNGRNGSLANWKLSASYHTWLTVLALGGYRTLTPLPTEWKKGIVRPTDGTDNKKAALAVARRLWANSDLFRREKDHNRADAALIGWWAYLQFMEGK